jgi:diguanylate cyclase (GGDEF)-like protein
LFQAVKSQAVTDALTTLYNRRYFEESLEKEVTRADRMKQPFSIIAIDLDYLKQLNDKFGHSIGDIAIKSVADVLKKNARSIDVAARMGGEEFNLLLPGVDSTGGMVAAERIRSAIAACEIEEVGHITASIGVATYLEHSDKIEELLEIADQAMYGAKRNGRNQVQMAKPISELTWQEIAFNTFMDILSKKRIPISKEISENISKKLDDASKKSDSPKEMIFSVADMLAKSYNPLHSKGVTKSKVQLTAKLAKAFELSEDEVNNLRIATLLYDIGNLMLPPEILQKTEPLTDDERAEIKKHPVIAAREILKPISEIQDVIPIIEHHHENWDGSGYPGKVSGEKIPLASQIILIADAYFALIEPRSYRKAMTSEEAIKVIQKDANKKWNPKLVKEFVAIVESSLKV